MDILPEYGQTVFVVQENEVHWPDEFVIITACNPNSAGDREADQVMHEKLGEVLKSIGCWLQEIEGTSPDLRHREIGYAVSGMSLERALELGRDFQQNAIFLIKDDALAVIGCYTNNRQVIGRFSERLKSLAPQ